VKIEIEIEMQIIYSPFQFIRNRKKEAKLFVFSVFFNTFASVMKKLIYFVFLVILFLACNNKGIIDKLDEIDSLVIHEQYDSADIVLSIIDSALIREAGIKAHYYLLRTQLACVLRKNDSTNLLDSIVIPYYKNTNNKIKLAEALYYKGYKEYLNGHIPEAIINYKLSEEQAASTSNLPLQYKIAESLSYVNGICNKYYLCIQYGNKCVKIANILDNKGWLAYSFHTIALAHSCLNHKDSFLIYMDKATQLKQYIADKDKFAFLANLAFTYKYSQPQIAKAYYQEALNLENSSVIIEHLADIYYDEGCQEEAYRLWKKALAVNDNNPKDIILHNLLDYDVEHGRTDSVCQYVNEIIAIKDSMIDNLRNDTIKDLQLRFDHEVAMRKQETITSNWQKGLLAAFLFISLLIAYIIIKRYREKTKMQEAQMQINDLMNQIRELEKSEEDNSIAIQKLNDQIKDLLNKEGPLLKQGKILYDQIVDGKTVIEWRKKDFELFINYYKAIDYKTVNRLKKTKRKEKLTPQKMFFLLLNEMGYNKKDITQILGVSDTSVNTLYFRTKPID
jgi:hypothetical protein